MSEIDKIWTGLTTGLPNFINTHGAAELLALLVGEERTEEQEGMYESLQALKDALSSDWDSMAEDGGTLNSDDNWVDYQEEQAYSSGDIAEHSHVADYVDWERYADSLKEGHREVEVEGGEFAGTWLYDAN